MGWAEASFTYLVHIVKTGVVGRADGAVVWVGAGLSVPSGYPTWNQLADALARRFPGTLAPELRGPDLIDAFVSKHGRGELMDALNELFPERSPLSFHRTLVTLPWNTIITTNFDRLLEKACDLEGIDYRLVILDRNARILDSARLPICKPHGCMSDWNTVVLDGNRYRKYRKTYPEALSQLQSKLRRHRVVFFGCSMTDPRVMDWLRSLPPEQRSELKASAAVLTAQDWDRLAITDRELLVSAHIQPVLVDSYSDIPALIENLSATVMRGERQEAGETRSAELNADLIVMLCNRTIHVDQVRESLPFRDGQIRPPHVYLIHGHRAQRGNSLIARLSRYEILQFAETHWGRAPRIQPLKKVEWSYSRQAERGVFEIVSSLFWHLGVSSTEWTTVTRDAGRRDELSAAEFFVNRYRASDLHMCFIQHDIETQRCNDMTGEICSRYMQFWDEVARLEPRTRFVVFVNLSYSGWTSNAYRRIKAKLEAVMRGSQCCRGVLPQLGRVKWNDVANWIAHQDITIDNPTRLLMRWFLLHPFGLEMEAVEPKLRQLLARRSAE
jgi:hypothetical protein